MVERVEGSDVGPEASMPEEPEPAESATIGEGVLTLVCLKCGTEYYFSEAEGAPQELRCEKCCSQVFREFSSIQGDAAIDDFHDSTARDLDPDDAEGEAMPGDILDLNRD